MKTATMNVAMKYYESSLHVCLIPRMMVWFTDNVWFIVAEIKIDYCCRLSVSLPLPLYLSIFFSLPSPPLSYRIHF